MDAHRGTPANAAGNGGRYTATANHGTDARMAAIFAMGTVWAADVILPGENHGAETDYCH